MQQDAAQKLGFYRHHSLVISVGKVFPAEGDLIVREGKEAMVGGSGTPNKLQRPRVVIFHEN